MTVKFTNNASSSLSSGINSTATSLTVADASTFPSLSGADDYCYLTIQQATATTREVVKATARSGNTFTVQRGVDNTTAASFSSGDTVELRLTSALLQDVIDQATVEGIKTNFQYVPTAGQTQFSGADSSGDTMIINDSELVNVYMNGVRLVQGSDYTVSSANNRITLTSGATTADIIDIEVFGNFTGQSGAAVAITGGAIAGTAITTGSINNTPIGATQANTVAATTLTANSVAVTGNATIRSGNKLIINRADNAIGGEITYGPTGTGFIINDANGDDTIFKTGSTEHMRIDGGTGNVGISGALASKDITVTASSDSAHALSLQRASSSGRAQIRLLNESAAEIWRFGATGSGSSDFSFFDGGANVLVLKSSDDSAIFAGNVGINTSSPSAKLDIVEATSTPAVKIKSGTSTNQNTHITMFNDNDGGTLALGVFGSSATTFGTITAGDGFISSNQELTLNSQNASGAIKFGVGSSIPEIMRIDSSGVGIGTTSVDELLHVKHATSNAKILVETDSSTSIPEIQFKSANNEIHRIGVETATGNQGYTASTAYSLNIFARDGRNTHFGSGSSQHMTILDGGDIGIGTSSPSFTAVSGSTSQKGLHIQNSGNDTSAHLKLTGHNNTGTPGQATDFEIIHRGDALQTIFRHGGANVLTLNSSGFLGVGRTDPTQLLEVHKNSGGDQTVAKFSAHNYGDTGKTFIEIGTEFGDGSSRIGSFNSTGNRSVIVNELHDGGSGVFKEAFRLAMDSSQRRVVRFRVSDVQNSDFSIISNDDGTAQAGIHLFGSDQNHSIFFRRGYDNAINVMDFHQYGTFRFFNDGVLASQTKKAEIRPDGDFHVAWTGSADTTGYFYAGQDFGATNHRINRAVSQGNTVLVVSAYSASLADSALFYGVSNGGSNTNAAAIRTGKNTVTSRSINSAGTINASGSDYAEYMEKKSTAFDISAGDVCGVNEDGKLTNKFTEAHSFVVKSTDPSYVGGDIWGSEDVIGKKPELTKQGYVNPEEQAPETDEEYAARKTKYETDLAAFEEALNAERIKYDRIAFSGQVPVNITGAKVGDYIVPKEKTGDLITAEAVTEPTFEQYQMAVGKVWKILEDGRAFISVKIG